MSKKSSLLLCCLSLWLFGDSHLLSQIECKQQDEFPTLLSKDQNKNNRIHISSVINTDKNRDITLHVEEYLDTENWNQLIQFKWQEKPGSIRITETVLVQNNPLKRIVVRYKPYSCKVEVFDRKLGGSGQVIDNETNRQNDKKQKAGIISSKKLFMNSSMNSSKAKVVDTKFRRRIRDHNDLIDSIVSTDSRSPYLAQVPTDLSKQNQVWVIGVLGLWLRAQYQLNDEQPIELIQEQQQQVGINEKESTNFWRLNLNGSSQAIFYHLNSALSLFANDDWSDKLPIKTISINQMNQSSSATQESLETTIRIVDLDFWFDDNLKRHLTSLPIGFNCQSNPLLIDKLERLHFIDRVSSSHLTEIELVATDLRGEGDKSSPMSDTKTLTVVESTHPVDPKVALTMFKIHEDQRRFVRDFKLRFMYTIKYDGDDSPISKSLRQQCRIEHLNIPTASDTTNYSSTLSSSRKENYRHQYANNLIDIDLANGITLTIDELLLEYILDAANNHRESMNYLNRAPIDDSLMEHVFESRVPKKYEHMISLSSKGSSNQTYTSLLNQINQKTVISINIVRIYQSKFFASGGGDIISPLKLVRVILIVYDKEVKNKLAEIRWNLVRQLQPLSLRRRAQMFDLSRCFKLEEDSMQMTINYQLKSNYQLNQAQARSYEIIEEFYRYHSRKPTSSIKNDIDVTRINSDRITYSFNYLRVPKVELFLMDKNVSHHDLSSEGNHRSETGQIMQLQLVLLNQPAPIYFFEQVDGVSFEGPIIDKLEVASVDKCASYCHQIKCRMFAFDIRSYECKLSNESIEDYHNHHPGDDLDVDVDSPNNSSRTISKVVANLSSKLYYLPIKVNLDTGEATLAEIYSFFQHNIINNKSIQLEEIDDDGSDGKENKTSRDRRSASVEIKPQLSFQWTNYDSDGVQMDKELIVPSGIYLSKIPLILNVSRENQDFRIAKAFNLKLTGKRYQLNAVDDWNKTPQHILSADERIYRNTNGQVYFTLKRLHAIEFDTCLQLCYEIDEWNFNTSSEQICRTFSYCSFEKQCILVIETEIGFASDPLLDLVAEGGDIVLPLIVSPDILLKDGAGCNVNLRSNLAHFDGPIVLTADSYGQTRSTDKLFEGDKHFEWLPQLSLESSLKPNSSLRENCAQDCLNRNKSPDRMCLAIDYCEGKISTSTTGNEAAEIGSANNSDWRRFYQHCDLFVIKSISSVNANEISSIKSKLQFDPSSTSPTSYTDIKHSHQQQNESVCQRYLISHLLEYNSLKRRTISQTLFSEPTLTIFDLDAEYCATECSLRKSNCILFEHCSRYDVGWKSVKNECKIFDQSTLASEWNGTRGTEVAEKELERSDLQLKSATNFSKDCHVYLRREFRSINEAVNVLTMKLSERSVIDKRMDHSWLIFGFILLYCPFCLLFIMIIKNILSGKPTGTISTGTINGATNDFQIDKSGTELSNLSDRIYHI